MECRYCGSVINHKKKHLKEFHPDIYQKMQHNRASIEINGKRVQYEYKCIQCGNCCRAGYKIVLFEGDLMKWKDARRDDLLLYLHVDQRGLSYAGSQGGVVNVKTEQEAQEAIRKFNKYKRNFNPTQHLLKLMDIYSFLSSTHTYLGEGKKEYDHVFGDIHTFPGTNWHWPIFSPKSYDDIVKGLEKGLAYKIRSDSKGCCLLQGNLCVIHEMKPRVCRLFPYKPDGYGGKIDLEIKTLKVCKGFKKL